MKLIVGLGNPGEKYEKTRHNLGFMVIEKFFKDFEPVRQTIWEYNSRFKSDIARIEWQTRLDSRQREAGNALVEKVILARPKTYMNNSGMAVGLISDFFKINPSDIWIVNDDIDLPLGAMKIRFGGASAGHHGVESIIKYLGTDKFWRFRMGIGNQKSKIKNQKSKMTIIKNVDELVLRTFSGSERGKVKEMIKKGAKAIGAALEEGMEASQNRFNTK